MQSATAAAEIIRPEGQGPIVFVCEHASNHFPDGYGMLGLTDPVASSHAAWDIGARDMAVALSEAFDAPLIAGTVSRLIYDLNRPPTAASAIPERSEIFDIPGNIGLTDVERQSRCTAWHDPFHAAVSEVLDRCGPVALVTVHSFTPVYNGVTREVEIGFLHDAGADFAKAALQAELATGRYRAALNEPYAATDGVTYTLAKHGESRGLANLMIEVRNDLIDTPESARAMAVHLRETLSAALTALAPSGVGS